FANFTSYFIYLPYLIYFLLRYFWSQTLTYKFKKRYYAAINIGGV
ncbi:MAG: hypothetical protein ACI9X8_002129, partial [Pseudoalteromonas distincta]